MSYFIGVFPGDFARASLKRMAGPGRPPDSAGIPGRFRPGLIEA